MNDEFRRAIEEIKLRLPVEEVVRGYVPTLKRQGQLWTACCPFHEEKTPSFKVDPRRGTWHCFGACGTGGDQISFVERAHRVEFREALEILAARAGVSLPDRRSRDGQREEDENRALYDVLERAQGFYQRQLFRPEGAAALAYARSRGLSDKTLERFGVGWAQGGEQGLVATALAAGVPMKSLQAAGLARENEHGRARDFFFKRMTIPVRDIKGRVVGFGARRLDDAAGGPKYVNTPETVLFHKGRLIYALDAAQETVRKSGELVLVEGYTDVMAAHQAGFENVVAVLGTATTEDHAALVRRSGARRVRLVFDGDEAGLKATYRALNGLLPLELDLEVVRLPGNEDPCDLLMRAGPDACGAFGRALEGGTDWFACLARRASTLSGDARWREVDLLLELLSRIPRPLVREDLARELARELGVPPASVREQLESLPERRRQAARSEAPARSDAGQAGPPCAAGAPDGARALRAWRALAGALLLDVSRAAEARQWLGQAPQAELDALLATTLEVIDEGRASDVDQRVQAVLARLGEAPARHALVPLLEEACRADEPARLVHDALATLREVSLRARVRQETECVERALDEENERQALSQLFHTLRHAKMEQPGAARGA